MESMEIFRVFEDVSDWVWEQVSQWPHLAQDTLGKQLVRSADNINANLVEGDGRFSDPDALKFFVIARGSARETRLWLRRAVKRRLVDPDEGQKYIDALVSGVKMLNLLIKYRRQTSNRNIVRELSVAYALDDDGSDPLAEPMY